MALLDQSNLLEAVIRLIRVDSDLATIHDRFGPPPLWDRPAGFASLVLIILEQQVSLASAKAAFDRLNQSVGSLTPHAFLALDDVTLKAIGFSRQKSDYARSLAGAVQQGSIDLDGLACLSDATVRDHLVQLKGIGPWSADIYLLMALLRPDVWPRGDLALVASVKEVKRLAELPDRCTFERIGAIYAPLRSVAARLYWWHYLNTRGRKGQ